jgi:predicted nucleotidyltransferase
MAPIDILNEHLEELQRQYNVSKIGIFGSFSRGEDRSSSDVDIIVEFSTQVDLFTFLELKEHLEAILGREIDLVTKNALKPLIKDRILSEVTYL